MSNTTIPLQIRLSHKYVGTYAYLDDWDTIGEITLENNFDEEVKQHDCWENIRQISITTIDQDSETKLPEAQIIRAIEECMSHGGCACSRDCCGCVSTTATVIINRDPIDPERIFVHQAHSRNY